MRKFIFVGLLVAAGQVAAQSACQEGSTACASAVANTVSSADNNITVVLPSTASAPAKQEIAQSGSTTVRNVPSVGGPPLTTSNDTCMGSTSGSVNIAGVGIGGGSTWVDTNCKMLKNSRELWNMGMRAAALALMCTDPDNRAALESTGFSCPQSPEPKRPTQIDTLGTGARR